MTQTQTFERSALPIKVANFDDVHLMKTAAGDMAFVPTRTMNFMSLIAMAIGPGLAYLMITDLSLVWNVPIQTFLTGDYWLLLIPLLFFIVGCVMWWHSHMTKRFSLADGLCYWGKEEEQLINISAIQLLSRTCYTTKGHSYESYQLNSIRKDGSRKNIANYANRDNAKKDAKKLADYLDVKLYNEG